MKIRFVPLAVLLLLGLATPAKAQEPERGQLYEVSIMKVDPGSLMTFIENVAMVKAAAEAGNLSEEFAWQTWLRDFEVGIVAAIPNMAALDDDQAFMAAFAGTPGEELFAQAMEKWEADGVFQVLSKKEVSRLSCVRNSNFSLMCSGNLKPAVCTRMPSSPFSRLPSATRSPVLR